MENSRAQIDGFLAQSHMALAGYSRDPKKFGHVVWKTLKEKGYTLYPVNPAGGTTPDGDAVYPDVASLPAQVQALLVMTNPKTTAAVVSQALESGIGHLWIQQMSGGKEIRDMLENAAASVVYDRCILMHASPTGIHKFHHWLAKMFGRVPVNRER